MIIRTLRFPLSGLLLWQWAACLQLVFMTASAQTINELKQNAATSWQSEPNATIRDLGTMAEICRKEGDKENFAWTLNLRGVIYGALGKFDSSYAFYDSSLSWSRRYGIVEIEKKTLMNLAINYQYQGLYEKSMKAYLDAIRRFETSKDTLGLAHAFSGLGGVYRETGEFEKSISVYFQSVNLYLKVNMIPLTGPVYSNLGALYRDLGKRDSALYCLSLAEPILIESNHQFGLMNFYINKAAMYQDDSSQYANELYEKAMNLAMETGDPRGRAISTAAVANQAFLDSDFRKGFSLGKSALKAAEEMNDLELTKQALSSIYRCALAMGMKNDALDYLIRYKQVSDTIFNIEGKKAMAEMRVKYESEKTEKELAQSLLAGLESDKKLARNELQITRQNRSILLLGGSATALFLFAIGLFYYQKERQHRLKKELELEESRRIREIGEEKLRIARELHDNVGSQLTFLVSSIDNLNDSGDTGSGKVKLKQLSDFGRSAMNDLRTAIWGLNEETTISNLALKCNDLVQRLNLNSDVRISAVNEIQTDRLLESELAVNILRIIRESLQNAIKHAEATEIVVTIHSGRQELVISIRDNGKGFEPAGVHKGGSGLENMVHRARQAGGNLEIVSGNGEGTNIILRAGTR